MASVKTENATSIVVVRTNGNSSSQSTRSTSNLASGSNAGSTSAIGSIAAAAGAGNASTETSAETSIYLDKVAANSTSVSITGSKVAATSSAGGVTPREEGRELAINTTNSKLQSSANAWPGGVASSYCSLQSAKTPTTNFSLPLSCAIGTDRSSGDQPRILAARSTPLTNIAIVFHGPSDVPASAPPTTRRPVPPLTPPPTIVDRAAWNTTRSTRTATPFSSPNRLKTPRR